MGQWRCVRLAHGRQIGFSEYGAPAGVPVIHCHGGLSCRIEAAFADDLCRELGVRLIVPDRPGIGRSPLQPGRRLLDWPDDVAALADALGIERFAVLGWSAGGPYALACAYRLGERVTRVATAAGMAPLDTADSRAALGLFADRVLFPLSRACPRLAGWLLSASRHQPAWAMRHAVLHSLESTGDPDAAFLRELPAGELSDFVFEALRQGGYGTALDYALLAGDWGFRLGEVSREVLVWHGEDDGLLSVSHARRLERSLPHASLTVVPEQGHFLPRRRMRELLSTLLA